MRQVDPRAAELIPEGGDFADFSVLADRPTEAALVRARFRTLADLI